MIGQTAEIAPLDRRLYALRDVTATVPVIPLIAASIMSKKLAEGLDGLILDVKVGGGAFIPQEDQALLLAETMVAIGAARGLPTVALLTAMDRPLGRAVGNALETAEAVACLKGEGPRDLEELVLREAAEMAMAGFPDSDPAAARAGAERALRSGRALERLERMVVAQGGDASIIHAPGRFLTAPVQEVVRSERSGTVLGVDPRSLGLAVVDLGGGRRRMDDTLHLGVGFQLTVAPGDGVEVGDPLGTVHAVDQDGLTNGAAVLRSAVMVGQGRPSLRPLVSHRVSSSGVAEVPG